jgi:hypothetical protein
LSWKSKSKASLLKPRRKISRKAAKAQREVEAKKQRGLSFSLLLSFASFLLCVLAALREIKRPNPVGLF